MEKEYCKIMKVLREEYKLSQTEIAKKLELKQSAYSNYERGEREPDINTLIKIANLYNITIDTLLGIENKKIEKLEENERIVLHKFRRLNEKNKIKAEERIDTLLDTQDEEEAKRKESA